MYQNLGIHWASSVPAFLALLCVPFPFLFYKYGESIRLRCKYAAQAAKALAEMAGEESEDEETEGQAVDQENTERNGGIDGEKKAVEDNASSNGHSIDGAAKEF